MFLPIKNKLVRSFSVMLTGNILAQSIGIFAAPLITRLYTPTDFGVMTYIWSIIMVISMGACLLCCLLIIRMDIYYSSFQ